MIKIIKTEKQYTTVEFDAAGYNFIDALGGQIGSGTTMYDGDSPVKMRIQHNKRQQACLSEMIEKHNDSIQISAATDGAETIRAGRVVVEAGSRKIGDEIDGKIISGFGRSWVPQSADFYSVNNINPAASYVQYAYLVEKK